jgi:hypothetical protein
MRGHLVTRHSVNAANIAVNTMLGNVRSVGLPGAALMIDSDRTTYLLRICTSAAHLRRSGLPHVAVAKLVLNDHD